MFSESDIKRFWSNVLIGGPDDCWEWKGAIGGPGYGELHAQGTTVTAHRMSYILAHNSIPAKMLICHHCNNRRCVNPSHLYAGTSSDNVHDSQLAGTLYHFVLRKGITNNKAKLNDDAVRQIRKAYEQGIASQNQLAAQFGVDQAAIWMVIHRKTWTHVE